VLAENIGIRRQRGFPMIGFRKFCCPLFPFFYICSDAKKINALWPLQIARMVSEIATMTVGLHEIHPTVNAASRPVRIQ